MGCEQCKLLLDANESESHDNVIANITAAEPADPCTADVGEDARPKQQADSLNQLTILAATSEIELTMENESAAQSNSGVEPALASLINLADVDSNILDSVERLEAQDEVTDLSAAIDEVGPSELCSALPHPPASEPDNSRDDTEECVVNPSGETTELKIVKRKATVRINSIRGHKVTRKLSINPGDAVISNSKRDFVQLGGHQGHFHIAGPGCLWKQQAKDGDIEAKVLKELNESSLHAYVPDYLGDKEHDGKKWIGMEDLMCHFTDGCGMDIKMGTRTFKESEVKNQNLRTDLYDKMVSQDPTEPTEQENIDKAITKLRYMTFRERESSSQTLGFRVEAMKVWGSETNKDFKKLKYDDQVKNALKMYFNPLSKAGIKGFLQELENLDTLLRESTFFKEHEFIGTSLLFIYDKERVGIWMIDFGKTTPIRDLIEGGQITHVKPWVRGNYEDGYFYGFTNLLEMTREIYEERGEDDDTVHQHTTLRVN